MFKKLKNTAGALTFRSMRSRSQAGSSQAGSNIDISSVPRSSSASQQEQHVLLHEKHNKLCTSYEMELLKLYKEREYVHTPTFDLSFLQATGMDTEFDLIFHNIG